MKAVLLAGGFGTRLSEETSVRPKPMVEIGGKPILWHILKIYSHYGINDFIICCGYKGYVIKEYFSNYFLHRSDVSFDLRNNEMKVLQNDVEPWTITLVDTGNGTMTGGRLKRVKELIGNETFCLTYGDGVSDVNITNLIDFHKSHKHIATVTAVQPTGRFGAFRLESEEYKITSFREKPKRDDTWINGGFFVLEPSVFEFIDGDETVFEREPMEQLAQSGELYAFRHDSFWECMDTLRDKNYLEDLWNSDDCPWNIWERLPEKMYV
ncbi:glucose-1-phosphate cytidylyltransferase [Fodinibius sp. SL11]|uniref:glucose-1-phosphate cytidylyltransferase n=1 Tax=Fodinibius sp. SL11 TaxID=3425690 RepID=UPI003F883B04